jgi:hypothetical protein
MLAETVHHEDSDEETPLEELKLTFAQVQDALEAEPFFAKIRTYTLAQPQGERKINGKMRGKLLAWLEKLSLATFKFRRGTFITATLILDQHLLQNDEPPSSLQLLGCAALLTASKLTEEVIVAPECYMTASCNIFNKQQLLEKERLMYAGVNWARIRIGSLRAVRLGCQRLGLTDGLPRAEEILAILLKGERSASWKESKLIYAVLSLTRMDREDGLTNEEVNALVEQF